MHHFKVSRCFRIKMANQISNLSFGNSIPLSIPLSTLLLLLHCFVSPFVAGAVNFECWKCSDSKTTCQYTYHKECPSINITNDDNLNNTKLRDNCNTTSFCKTLRVQHLISGEKMNTDKGCGVQGELNCFEQAFDVTVPQDGCSPEIEATYQEYTNFIDCNVKAKVKVATKYNAGVVKIMKQMADFYGKGGPGEFKVKYCKCDTTTKGCNYNQN